MARYNALEALDKQLEQAKATVELGNALERIRSNRDFKKLIIEGYFEREATRLVHLKADANMQSETSQANIIKQMDAIGQLNQYFGTVVQMASLAEKVIESGEADRADLLAEEIQ